MIDFEADMTPADRARRQTRPEKLDSDDDATTKAFVHINVDYARRKGWPYGALQCGSSWCDTAE